MWLVETGIFDDEFYAKFKKTAEDNGIECELTGQPYTYVFKYQYTKFTYPNRSIFYGSVNTAIALGLGRNREIDCGVFYNKENLSWGTYAAYWFDYLLNKDSIIVTLADLLNRYDEYADLVSREVDGTTSFFIRPFHNDKSFNGVLLLRDFGDGTIEKILTDDGYYANVEPDTLAVISSPKKIQNEWRFFIAGRKVIASTQYAKEGQPHYKEGCNSTDAYALVDKIVRDDWQPDFAYSVDICESDGKAYVLELGCINCSDLYDANVKDFITKLSKARDA